MDDLAKLKEAAEKATPGPWWACIGDDQPVAHYRGLVAWLSSDPGATVCTGEPGDRASGESVHDHAANARFIALAREGVPELFARLEAAEAAHEAALARVAVLEGALTPSAETKAAYMGEFSFTEHYEDAEGFDRAERRVVPWTTVKEIMAAILSRAALRTEGEGQ